MNTQLGDHFTFKKLIKFVLPAIGTMMFTSIYGMVDGFFVSNFIGKTPLTAINLIAPVHMILATVGFMFGTGGTAIVSKTMGEGDEERANRYFSLFVCFAFAIGAVLGILSCIFMRPLAYRLGARDEVLEACVVYGRIIMAVLPFFVMQLLFHSFFIAAEKNGTNLLVTIAAGVTNMILDAILVILLPNEYKLIGAAVATAISQVIGGGVPLIYFLRKNSSKFRLKKPTFEGRALLKATINGSSEFMSNVSMNLVAVLFNFQLDKFAGPDGIAAYGVMMYVSFLFASAFIGYSIGVAPLVGFNFGAGNKTELKNLLRKSLTLIGSMAVVMVLVAEAIALPLTRIFVGYDADLASLTLSGFRIFSLGFMFMGFAIFGSGFFTALNDGITSAIISFLRTVVFEVACVLILPKFLGVDGIWFSIVAAEFMAVLLSFIFLKTKQKRFGY